MIDLTAITTPFCLMDDETKDALMAHIGALQILNFHGAWEDIPSGLHWQANSTYRVKPAPPKPREWWIRLDQWGNECGTDRVVGPPPPNWNPDLTIRVIEVPK